MQGKVMVAKPQRGREMKTQEVGIIGGNAKTALMHEGYVGGQKYLVPDDELDVMKELVNYNIGKGPKDRYIRNYAYKSVQPGHEKRLHKMTERLRTRSSERSGEHSVDDTEDNRKIKFADEDIESEIRHYSQRALEQPVRDTMAEMKIRYTNEETELESNKFTPRALEKFEAKSSRYSQRALEQPVRGTMADRKIRFTNEDSKSESSKSSQRALEEFDSKSSQYSQRALEEFVEITMADRKIWFSNEDSKSESSKSSQRASDEFESKSSQSSQRGLKDFESKRSKSSQRVLEDFESESSRSSQRTVLGGVEDTKTDRTFRLAEDDRESGSSPASAPETSPSPGPLIYLEKTPSVYTERKRFLISGHFRNHLKPIFIFHEFNGDSPFSGKEVDFSTTKSSGNVDFFIKGMFFGDSILEEHDNELISLMVKPNRIMIDRRRDQIYEDQFFEVVQIGEVVVEIEGKFLKQSNGTKYTPFFSLNVSNIPASKSSDSSRAPTVFYLTDTLSKSIFQRKPSEQKVEKVHTKEEAIRKEAISDSPLLDQPKPPKAIEVHGGGNCVGTVKKDSSKDPENKEISNNLVPPQRLASELVSVFMFDIPEVVITNGPFTGGKSEFPSKNIKSKDIQKDSEISQRSRSNLGEINRDEMVNTETESQPPPDCKTEHGSRNSKIEEPHESKGLPRRTANAEDKEDVNQKKIGRKEEPLVLPESLRHQVDPYEYEPHLSKYPSHSTTRTSTASSSRPPVKPKDAGDVGSQDTYPEGTLVYYCQVRNRSGIKRGHQNKKGSKGFLKKFANLFS